MNKPTYKFAGIELDTARRQVRSSAKSIEPPPMVFEALETLVSRSGQAVSKDELADILWPDRVVTEASMTQVIRKARVVLEQCGVDPKVIKTQHGHGYRLDAEVTVSDSDAPSKRWQERRIRTGAIVALLGGVLVALANISDLLQWVVPNDSAGLLEETQSVVESTDAKVDEVVRLLREQAARSGEGLDPNSENTIRAAIEAIVNSVDARKKSAFRQLSLGNVAAAADQIVEVANDLDTASEKSIEAAAESWREAGAIYYISNLQQAILSYESAYRLLPDNEPIAIELAFAYLRAGRLDDALGVFEAVEVEASSEAFRSDALRGAGIILKMRGSFDEASGQFERAIQSAEEAGDRRRTGLALLQQGTIARSRGEKDLAKEQFQAAVSYAKEIEDKHLLASALNNLGIILAQTKQFVAAERTLNEALDIHRARHDLADKAQVLGNLGATALLQDDVELAESYLIESVAIGEQLGWQRSVALDLINLGTIAASQQRFNFRPCNTKPLKLCWTTLTLWVARWTRTPRRSNSRQCRKGFDRVGSSYN